MFVLMFRMSRARQLCCWGSWITSKGGEARATRVCLQGLLQPWLGARLLLYLGAACSQAPGALLQKHCPPGSAMACVRACADMWVRGGV